VDAFKKQLPLRNAVCLALDAMMDINEEIGHNIGHRLLLGSKLGIA